MEIPQYSGEDRKTTGPQVYQPNGSNVGAHLGQAARQGLAVSTGYLGYKAGKNHWELTQEGAHAAWRGSDASRRWGSWLIALGFTVFSFVFAEWTLFVVTSPTYQPVEGEEPM